MDTLPAIGAVIIGRNEGARLVACLAALPEGLADVVYVDSGSTDGSLAAAEAAGVRTIALDPARPFSAARARNEGFEALTASTAPEFVQFIDGDCLLAPGWLEAGAAFLRAHPGVAVACGHNRERFPEVSVYNRLADREWNTPVGPAQSCGGNALIRAEAFAAVGGFNPTLIAGEEAELCARLMRLGWGIQRLDAEMTAHDLAMTRFSQWWRRMRRGGLAAAQGAQIHAGAAQRGQLRRALLWGIGLPALALGGTLLTPWSLGLLLALPAQVLRLALREGAGDRTSWEWAFFATLGKLPEAVGVLDFALRRMRGGAQTLIEHK